MRTSRSVARASSLPFSFTPGSFRGGLLVVSGPALEGKWPLAAALAERLPDAILLGKADDLGAPADEKALLMEAAAAWHGRTNPAATLLVTGRFATKTARQRAARLAQSENMAFLLIECSSSPIRSLRKVSRMFLPPQETVRRIERYQRAKAAYVPVSAPEKTSLPALTLRGVLADLDEAAERAAQAWSRI